MKSFVVQCKRTATLLFHICYVIAVTGHQPEALSNERQLSAVSSLLQRARRSSAGLGWSFGGMGGRYTARSTRTFSNDEIDAFNQGLHRKRPKFIGKRQAVDVPESIWAPEAGPSSDCSGSRLGTEDDGKLSAEDKRTPPRKFMGRRSWLASKNVNGYDDEYDADDEVSMLPSGVADHDDEKRTQAVPRRKFVGKRPANRKFVGKRAFYNLDDARESASSDRDNEKSPGASTDDGSSDNVKAANADDHWLQAAKLLITADQSAAPSNADSKRANRKYVG